MTLTLELPQDLEEKLMAGAEGQGVPLEQYALSLLGSGLLGNLVGPEPRPTTGAEIVAYWHRHGVIGSRPEIVDSQSHARNLRHAAERRNLD